MAKLTLKKLLPADLPDGKVYVKKLKGAGNVRIFKDSDNAFIHTTAGAASSTTDAQAAALFTTLKAGDETYVMEGVDPGELFLTLEYTDGKLVCRDVVRVVVMTMEFIRDGMNDQTVDETDPVITHANIGHWGEDVAFAAGDGVNGYTAGGAVRNAAPPDNFINLDPRRFHVRVQDVTRNRDRAAREVITARIATLNPAGMEDDDFTDFELRETGNDTGIFVSQAHLLMSADLGAAAGDRTHRATIDGFARGQYRASDMLTCSNTIPVCRRHAMPAMDERRVLKVHVTVFNEPYQDTGYDDDNNAATPDVGAGNGRFDFTDTNGNMRHDAGEASEPFLDLSTGAAVHIRGGQPGAGSRGGVAHVDAQFARVNIA